MLLKYTDFMFLVVIYDNEECSGFGLDWLDKEAL